MRRSEAEERARLLQAEDPDRATHRFVARPSSGDDWEVVKVQLPTAGHGPLTPTVGSGPRPSPADDPRTGHERRAPGFPGGLA
jgi:hypothetical protein